MAAAKRVGVGVKLVGGSPPAIEDDVVLVSSGDENRGLPFLLLLEHKADIAHEETILRRSNRPERRLSDPKWTLREAFLNGIGQSEHDLNTQSWLHYETTRNSRVQYERVFVRSPSAL